MHIPNIINLKINLDGLSASVIPKWEKINLKP